MNFNIISPDWPALPFPDWENTKDTVHMWTQIVGKTKMSRTPLVNHWWNVALYATPVGLSTSSIPIGSRSLDIEFDFVSHRLVLRTSEGRGLFIPLYARSVADFYAEYISSLHSLGVEVRIDRVPVEFDDVTPFDEDRHHDSYDKEYVERFRRILNQVDRVLKQFRTSFIGKCSPVHFFWGSFDLAVTRFSGRRAPERADADSVTREAYSHEVISCGFWPGDRRFKYPAFYSYLAPSLAELANQAIQPPSAYSDDRLGEFILKYDDVRAAASPERAILDFYRSTYEAAANLARWDREVLERSG